MINERIYDTVNNIVTDYVSVCVCVCCSIGYTKGAAVRRLL